MDYKTLLFSFEGRINRAKYWGGSLLLGILPILIILVFSAADQMFIGLILCGIYSLIVIYPAFAIAAKRWHDRDKSAVWILIGFIPIIGSIWVFIECGCLKGTTGDNRYGSDPLEVLTNVEE